MAKNDWMTFGIIAVAAVVGYLIWTNLSAGTVGAYWTTHYPSGPVPTYAEAPIVVE